MNPRPRKSLHWELRVVMAKRRIKSIAELKRRLDAVGYDISEAQLGRIADQPLPPRLNVPLLEALITVLDCDVLELLVPGADAQVSASMK